MRSPSRTVRLRGPLERALPILLTLFLSPKLSAYNFPTILQPNPSQDTHSAPTTPESECSAKNEYDYDERARSQLAGQGVTENQLRRMAEERLHKRGVETFDTQRVEVTGIISGSPDATDLKFAGFFNYRVALSFFADHPEPPGFLEQKWYWLKNAFGDVEALRSDRAGIISARADSELRVLIDHSRVNELWAHSWGTDAVYAAILNDTILPPRKLMLFALPSTNLEKWRALSAATGTEIHIWGYDQDAVTSFHKLPYHLLDGVRFSIADLPGQVTDNPRELAASWNAWCIQRIRQRASCRPRQRHGGVSVVWNLPAGTIRFHYRSEYYDYLRLLHQVVPVEQLNDDHTRLIADESYSIVRSVADRIRRAHPPTPCGVQPAVAAAPAARPSPAAAAVRPPSVQRSYAQTRCFVTWNCGGSSGCAAMYGSSSGSRGPFSSCARYVQRDSVSRCSCN